MHLYCNPPDSFYMPGTRDPRYSLVVCLELFIDLGNSESISEINHAQRLSEINKESFEPSCCSEDAPVEYTVPWFVAKYSNMRIFNPHSKQFEELAAGGYNWDDATGEIKEYPTAEIGGGHKEIIVMDISPDSYLTDAEGYKYANTVTIEPSSKFVVSETDCRYRRPTILLDMLEDYSEISLECNNVGQSTKRGCAYINCGDYPTYSCIDDNSPPCSGPCSSITACPEGFCPEGQQCCESLGVSVGPAQCLNDESYNVLRSSRYSTPPELLFKVRDKLKGIDYVQLNPLTWPDDPMYALEADNISVDLNNQLNFKVVYNKKRGTLPTYPTCASYSCPAGTVEVYTSSSPCGGSGGGGYRPPDHL